MKPGSLLLMTQSTVHSSLDNVTPDQVRISFDLRYQPTGQPTGRPAFAPAGFIARSAAHPESVVHDPAVWQRNWLWCAIPWRRKRSPPSTAGAPTRRCAPDLSTSAASLRSETQ